jgi:uncharacterized membrane protein
MLYAVLKALHLLAVVLWVGGMAFTVLFLRPSLSVLQAPAERLKLMHAVLGRFFSAVLWSTIVILASGLWMIGRVARATVQSGGNFSWPLDWIVMLVLGLVMMALFGHIRFVLYRRLDRALSAGDITAASSALASIRPWVTVNLGLGVGLIVAVLLV